MSDSASIDEEELEILLEKFFFKKNTSVGENKCLKQVK